jgi:hypothetical protein
VRKKKNIVVVVVVVTMGVVFSVNVIGWSFVTRVKARLTLNYPKINLNKI